jgi:ribonuclease E
MNDDQIDQPDDTAVPADAQASAPEAQASQPETSEPEPQAFEPETQASEPETSAPESHDAAGAGGDASPRRRGRRRAASRPAGPPAAFFSAAAPHAEPVAVPSAPPVAAVAAVFQAPDLTPAPAREHDSTDVGASTVEASNAGGSEADQSTGGVTSSDERSEPGESTVPDGEPPAGDRPAGKRRRRGGRGRRRKSEDGASGSTEDATATPNAGDQPSGNDQGGADSSGEGSTDAAGGGHPDAPGEGQANGDGEPGTRRRRRRRRRGSAGGEGPRGEDDPPNTVVKVREPRRAADEVTAVKGSTRLEAKKQRRREGRESRGRRAPILTEAEFLSRRESVDRRMVVRQRGELTQIGVLEDDVLVEHYVSNAGSGSMIGNVYLGKVQNVLPSMEAAFVDLGRGRNAVLYAGEVNWDAAGLEGQPKRIELALKPGDSVLVQVTKDPMGHKGARLTSQISLPGRFLVYVPEGGMTGISRKLPDRERSRLKKILRAVMPENSGVIVRTAAEGASEDELANDVARLAEQWEAIQKKSATASAPSQLRAEPDLAIKVVRDIFNEDFAGMVVSGDQAYAEVHDYVNAVAPDLAPRLTKWTQNQDVFTEFRIDEQLAKALDRKVWLPSGGSLVIDRTEAMTVVDVNTGKFTGKGGNLEETVTRNNLEAAEEIVRQLRLRDIGGIIVVDFIDMVLESNRDLVLRRLVECLSRDRTKHQVAEVTTLGLVQMTRKRIGQGLLETFSETCEACSGRGVKIHTDPLTAAGPGSTGGSDPRVHRTRRPKVTGPIPGAPRPEPTEESAAPEAKAPPAADVQEPPEADSTSEVAVVDVVSAEVAVVELVTSEVSIVAGQAGSSADAEAHPEADAEANPEADAEAHPEADAEATPEAEAEATPEADAEAPKGDSDASAEAVAESTVVVP